MTAILKNMQLLLFISTNLKFTSFTSYESTLHLFLYLKAELRYIRFRFSAVFLAAILNFFILLILDNTQQYSTNQKSLKSDCYFHCISYLIEVILVSRIGYHILAAILAAILENIKRMILEVYPIRFADQKNFRKK